jgi:hypothetical protein
LRGTALSCLEYQGLFDLLQALDVVKHCARGTCSHIQVKTQQRKEWAACNVPGLATQQSGPHSAPVVDQQEQVVIVVVIEEKFICDIKEVEVTRQDKIRVQV